MSRSRAVARGALIAVVVMLSGCAGSAPRLYVNPEADMAYYKRVAVLPFQNLTPERFAGERLTRSFITELIIADRYQLVEPADFWIILERIGGTPGVSGAYDPKKLQEAAKEANVTGIIRGAVSEYQIQRSGGGDSPILAFDVELMDVATSNVVWRASLAKRGKGRVPIVGGGERTLGRLTEESCREMVGRLEKEAF